ncbi:hypothetical protein [Bacillus cihuensis]|uniref:hypothetical protein n=1 Tax=Bacillus cihuensis TaxID=1208599 RepID=UPI000416BF95|nr:hypothetical protein [Bacillus cihuensis]
MTTMENRFIELFMIRFNDGKHDWLEDDEWQKIVSEMEELENFIDKEKVSKKLKELFGLN